MQIRCATVAERDHIFQIKTINDNRLDNIVFDLNI